MDNCVVCHTIDDSTVEIIRNGVTAVLHIEGLDVIVINPNVLVDKYPLVTYSEPRGQMFTFNRVLGNICRNVNCDIFFSSDIGKHMKCGYPVCQDKILCNKFNHIAEYVYNKWLEYHNSKRSECTISETYFDV